MRTVKKTVSSLDGVETVTFDFESRTATITMAQGKTLTKETLDKAFKETKFAVTKFEQVGEAKEEKKEEKKEDPPKKEDGAKKDDGAKKSD